jgi:hypothetical protein
MAGAFMVRWNGADNRMEIAMGGAWDIDTMYRFEAQFHKAVNANTRPGWALLNDLRSCPAQSDEVQHRGEAVTRFSAAHGCVRAVVVVPRAVGTMQIKRLAKATQSGSINIYVTSMEEADEQLRLVASA